MRRVSQLSFRAAVLVAAVLILVTTYFPLVFVLSNSLKTSHQLLSGDVFSLFTSFDFTNYVQAWSGVSLSLLNTIIVAALSVVVSLFAAVLGGFAFAQARFRGKGVVFMGYLGLLMIPWTLTLIPLFLLVKTFGLFDNWGALILPYSATAQPLLVLIFRGFFEQLPAEVMQSARVDGCGELQVLRRIIAPLAKPILLTGTILVTINVWGDYLWPTIVLQDYRRFTISAGLQQFVNSFGLTGQGAGAVFAAYVLTMGPLLLLVGLTMRQFVTGMTEGAVKL